MKATELMINDWIYSGIKKSPVILKPSDYRAMIEQPDKVFDDDGNFIWLKPIPLTEEILNANEWHNNGHDYYTYSGDLERKNLWLIDKVLNESDVIESVHEFQHLLRLCKRDDLADNFKLK